MTSSTPTASTAAPADSLAPAAPVNPLASAPTINVPSPVACAIETANVKTAIPLFTRGNARAFAEAFSGPLRLVIPPTGDAIAELARPGLELRAIARPSLHPTAPMVLWGVLSVSPEADLGWSGGSAGMLVPVVNDKIFQPARPIEPRPCKDFGLDIAKYDPLQPVPKGTVKFTPRTRRLTDKRAITLSLSATEAPLGTLDASFNNAKCKEIAQSSGRSLISVNVTSGVLFGWVPIDDVGPDEKFFGIGGAAGAPGKLQQSISNAAIFDVVCSHDVRVIADLSREPPETHGGAPFTVIGTIRAGSKFTYRSQGELLVPILEIPGVSQVRGSISVEVDAMKDCKRTAQ